MTGAALAKLRQALAVADEATRRLGGLTPQDARAVRDLIADALSELERDEA